MTRLLALFVLLSAPVHAKDAPKPPPKEEPRKPAPPAPEPPDCNRTASCRCNDPAWDRFSPCDPNPSAVLR